MVNSYRSVILVTCFSCVFAGVLFGQDGQIRSITSDDFADKRPSTPRKADKKGSIKGSSRAKSRTYKPLRSKKPAKVTSPVQQERPKSTKIKVLTTDVGITMWRLRPPAPYESGFLLPVRLSDGQRASWIPERVALDEEFQAGDRVRFAVESYTKGYVYVFNRETYADGSSGRPKMIFPESLRDDNRVSPGILLDFPDRREDVPYFVLRPKKDNYSGESVTVVISVKPLTNFTVDGIGYLTNPASLAEMEAAADFDIFEREDIADAIYTRQEAEATCGIKTRELERERPAKQICGSEVIPLDPNDSPPQSIFRVRRTNGAPSVVLFTMSANHSP